MRRTFFLAVAPRSLGVALVVAGLAAEHAHAQDTTATKAALLATDSALAGAVQAEGPAAFLRALEPRAAVVFTGQPILRGAAEARAPFTARYGAPSSYSWRPAHAVASTDGRFGCTIGLSRFTNGADSTRTERRGTYTTCWRLDASGTWRIAGHHRNDSPDKPPRATDDALLPAAPHSATVSIGSDPLAAAQSADSAFAALAAEQAGPGPAFARFAAPDGMLLTPAALPRGPEQISATFASYPSSRVILWEPMRDLGAGSGGLAFTVGHSTNTPRPGSTGPVTRGAFLTVWRQNADGSWSYIFDIGAPRP